MFKMLTVMFICLISAVSSVNAAGIVKGISSASYIFEANRTASFLLNYSNNGFNQSVTKNGPGSIEVEVEVKSSPMNSLTPFPIPDEAVPPGIKEYSESYFTGSSEAIEDLSANLTRGSKTQYDAVNSVLLWVSENIAYTDVSVMSDVPESVYSYRKANCVGRVNLALALLRGSGIPSRKVHGLCIDNAGQEKSKLGQSFFHRWLEIYYPDIGWVFSDPGRSLNTIDARYLVIDPDTASPYHIACHSVSKISSTDRFFIVDSVPGSFSDIVLRPNNSTRFASAVVGIFDGIPFTGLDGGRISIFRDGEQAGEMRILDGKRHFSFTDLSSNRKYSMQIKIPGFKEKHLNFSTSGDRVKIISIKLAKDKG